MKKIYFSICLFVSTAAVSDAQITVTQADLPVVGLAFTTAVDTNYVSVIPAGGAGQTWNYSGLLNFDQDTVGFIPAAGTPFAAQFPTANLATYSPSTANYAYFTSNSSGFYQNGVTDSAITGGVLAYNPANLFIPVPFTYNDTRTSNARAEILASITDSTGTVNVRITHNVESNFLCDGWGTLQLPNATHNNTLRVRVTEQAIDSLFIDLTGLGFYIFFGADTSTTINYRWIGNGPAAYLLGIEADSLGTSSVSSEYLLNYIVLGTQNIGADLNRVQTYPSPAADRVHFKWNSNLNPTGLVVSDATGRVVMNAEMRGMSTLDVPVSGMANGIYYYQLKLDNGTMEKGKFMVAH